MSGDSKGGGQKSNPNGLWGAIEETIQETLIPSEPAKTAIDSVLGIDNKKK